MEIISLLIIFGCNFSHIFMLYIWRCYIYTSAYNLLCDWIIVEGGWRSPKQVGNTPRCDKCIFFPHVQLAGIEYKIQSLFNGLCTLLISIIVVCFKDSGMYGPI